MGPMKRQAIELAKKGLPTCVIAAKIGSTERSVKTMLSMARRAGYVIPYLSPPGASYAAVHLDPIDRAQLELEAELRGLSTTELLSRLITTIVADDMFAAILDL